MPWQVRRGDRRYYYRSVRVGGVVKKRYFGSGPRAQEQARLDAERRLQRQAASAALAAEQARVALAGQMTDELLAWAPALVEAALTAAGLRQHRGEWRRPRNDRN